MNVCRLRRFSLRLAWIVCTSNRTRVPRTAIKIAWMLGRAGEKRSLPFVRKRYRSYRRLVPSDPEAGNGRILSRQYWEKHLAGNGTVPSSGERSFAHRLGGTVSQLDARCPARGTGA
jgi:hypothetical protein